VSKAKPKAHSANDRTAIVKAIDYDLLADAIVRAQINASNKAKEHERQEADKAASEWHKALGIKRIDEGWNPFKRKFYSLRNTIVGIWHLLFLRKDDTYKDTATVALLASMASWIIGSFKVVLYIVLVAMVVCASRFSFTPLWLFVICFGLLLVSIFLVARLLRIVQFEIEKIQDSQYLVGLLSALLAIIALALSVVAWLFPK